ncbi:hypothetical protein ACTFIZ_008543 [Dictyostelium cf. discoideum]
MENQKIGEKLFWSVFRNKYLNKIIFKRSDFKLNAYTYYEMNNVEWIINNKHFSLLREKVMRNDRNLNFLIRFFINPIFAFFKDDYEFYYNLFGNYGNNKYISKLTLSDLEFYSRMNDNVALLKILIDKSKDYINLELFYKFICIGAINSSIYLYNNFFKDYLINNQPKSTNELWYETIGYSSEFNPKFKYWKKGFYIELWNNTNRCSSKLKSKFDYRKYFFNKHGIYFKKVEFYVNFISKSIPPFSKHLNNTSEIELRMTRFNNPIIFDLSIHKQKLKHLIVYCKTILLLLLSVNQTELNYSKDDIIEMEQLNQWEIQFSKSELNTEVSSFSYKNEKVKRLFKMMLPFCGNRIVEDDYKVKDEPLEKDSFLFYQTKYNGEMDEFSKKEFLPISFGFYNYRHINNHFNCQRFFKNPFEFSMNDRNDRIIPFFKDAIKDHLDPSIERYFKHYKVNLINVAVIINDFEILQMVYNQLYNNNKSFEKDEFFLFETCYNDKLDTRIFDFIIYKIPERSRLNILNVIDRYYNLANHFKNNYPIDYKNSILHYELNLKSRLLPNFYIIKFLLENYKDFVDNLNQIQIRLPEFIYCHVYNAFKIRPLLTYKNSDGVEVEIKPTQYTLIDFNIFRGEVASQLNWVMNNRIQDIKDGTLQITYDKILLTQYLRNNIEETILNDINNSYYQQEGVTPTILNDLLDEIAKRGDIITIEFIIDQFKNNKPFLNHIISTNYTISKSFSSTYYQTDFYNYLDNKS